MSKFPLVMYLFLSVILASCGEDSALEGTTSSSGSSGAVLVSPSSAPFLIVSGPGNYWRQGQFTELSSAANVTVDVSTTYQYWDGFGGTFNEAGWDALAVISEADRNRAIKLLFDKKEGAAFSYGRIPIGANDYAMNRYSLAETPRDYEMNDFSISRDKKMLIPYVKAALSVRPDIKFWASPWAPPIWMMDTNAGEKYPSDSGRMKSDENILRAHALYLARFVEEYAKEGIDIDAVQPQNEPDRSQHYPSCAWSAALLSNYISNYLGPLFAERLPSTEVWLGTISSSKSDNIVSTVMSGPSTDFVKGIGLQWGMQQNAARYASTYQVPVMQTEHQCGNYPEVNVPSQNAPNDYAYAEESWGLLKSWIEAGVNSYMAWNMVLDQKGANLDEEKVWYQNALLVVDRQTKKLILTPAYFVFRHLSQYVSPGAVRVKVSGGDGLSFKNPDGSIVIILHNASGSENVTTLAVGGKRIQFKIPSRGFATLKWL